MFIFFNTEFEYSYPYTDFSQNNNAVSIDVSYELYKNKSR